MVYHNIPELTPSLCFAVMQYKFPLDAVALVQVFDDLVGRWGERLVHVEKLKEWILVWNRSEFLMFYQFLVGF